MLDKKELSDPGDHLTPEEVKSFYAGAYPDLVNAKLSNPKINEEKGTITYAFDPTTGTKG